MGLVTFSHWILDFIVHSPDLPIFGKNSLPLGLGLWNSGPGFIISIILEFILFTGGLMIYRLACKKKAFHKSLPPAV